MNKPNSFKSIYYPNIFDGANSNISYFDNDTRYYTHARVALLNILKGLNLQQDDKILLPSLICKDVLGPINQLNLKTVFYDVNEKLEIVNLPFEKNIKVLLYVNYFGFPQNQKTINDYVKENDIITIEDNAHGFLSYSEDKPLGTRGDFGIFSIRKTIPINEGACLTWNNKNVPFELPSIDKNLLPASLSKNKIRSFANCLSPKNMQQLTFMLRQLRKIKTGSEFPIESSDSENSINAQMGQMDLTTILKKLNYKKEISRRRQLYSDIAQLLSSISVPLIHQNLSEGICPYAIPFIDKDNQIEEIKKYLFNQGLECFNWPELPSQTSNNCLEFYNNIWAIRLLW